MAKFQLLAGKHHAGDTVYNKGDVIESAKPLHKIFRNKFKKRTKADEEDEAEDAAEETTEEGDEAPKKVTLKLGKGKSKDKKDKGEDARGKDVTSKFESAEENNFKVFKKDGKYSVYEEGEATPLKGCAKLAEKAVAPAITKFLEE